MTSVVKKAFVLALTLGCVFAVSDIGLWTQAYNVSIEGRSRVFTHEPGQVCVTGYGCSSYRINIDKANPHFPDYFEVILPVELWQNAFEERLNNAFDTVERIGA